MAKKKAAKKKPAAKKPAKKKATSKKATRKTTKRKQGRPKTGESPFKEGDSQEIFDLYHQGWSFPQIAQKYGVHTRSVESRYNRMRRIQAGTNPNCTPQLLFAELEAIKRLAFEHFRSNEPFERVHEFQKKLGQENENGDKRGGAMFDTEKMSEKYRSHQLAWLAFILECVKTQSKIMGVEYDVMRQREEMQWRIAGLDEEENKNEMIAEIIGTLITCDPSAVKTLRLDGTEVDVTNDEVDVTNDESET